MTVSMNAVGYGTVAVTALVLVLARSPAERSAAAGALSARPQAVPAYSAALARRLADAVGPDAPPGVAEGGGVRLRSVGFTRPGAGPVAGEPSFPPGPGVDVVTANCMSCHTPGQILTQPKLTRAEWVGEVAKMVTVYKAPVDQADVPAIVAYLTALPIAP